MKLDKIIIYILYKLRNTKQNIGRLRILKLLYLIDLISLARTDKKITNIKYYYYMFGPYSDSVIKTINKLVQRKIINDYKISTKQGISHDYRLDYQILENIKNINNFLFQMDKEQQEIIDEVIEKYGKIKSDELLNIIYTTKPMINHVPGDILI